MFLIYLPATSILITQLFQIVVSRIAILSGGIRSLFKVLLLLVSFKGFYASFRHKIARRYKYFDFNVGCQCMYLIVFSILGIGPIL